MDTLTQLQSMLQDDEQVLWYGQPNKKCFVLESIFNPLLPFALVWALFDFGFMYAMAFSDKKQPTPMLLFAIPFFALHLMPVWLYLGGVLLCFRNYKNTHFIITDKAVYTSGGYLSLHFERKAFDQITYFNIHRGFFDQRLGVGDIIFDDPADFATRRKQKNNFVIHDIPDFQEVYNIIREQKEKSHK